jgi:hypothetical protein
MKILRAHADPRGNAHVQSGSMSGVDSRTTGDGAASRPVGSSEER